MPCAYPASKHTEDRPRSPGGSTRSTPPNDLLSVIASATQEKFWEAHSIVHSGHSALRVDGGSPLHLLVLATTKLAQSVSLTEEVSEVFQDYGPPPPWVSAATALLYRLVVTGKCAINAQNKDGNTALHLACLKPHTHFLVRHLIRLGADPELRNNRGLHVHYDMRSHRGWLVKGMPGLACGIWSAIKRENTVNIDRHLAAWCRTAACLPNGQTMHEVAFETGNYDLVKLLDKAERTNELVAASMALDLQYVQQLLTSRPGKTTWDLNTMDFSCDPPRPLTAELWVSYGNRADQLIHLLTSNGFLDDQLYISQLDNELNAFDTCPFVKMVSESTSVRDLEKAWNLVGEQDFRVSRRRRRDQATYLHFLVERYFALRSQPTLRRSIVRLMFRVALAGIDVQARDVFGRTALNLAAVLTMETEERVAVSSSLLTQTSERERGIMELVTEPESCGQSEGEDETKKRITTRIPWDQSDHEGSRKTFRRRGWSKTRSYIGLSGSQQLEQCSMLSLYGSMGDQISFVDKRYAVRLPDQLLLGFLMQLGIDSSMGDLSHEYVLRNFYVPRDSIASRQLHRRLLRVNSEWNQRFAIVDGFPGIWPYLDSAIVAIDRCQPPQVIDCMISEVERAIRAHLVRLRAKRWDLDAVDLARASLPQYVSHHQPSCGCGVKSEDRATVHQSNLTCPRLRLIRTLQSFVGATEFAAAAMAGDLTRMQSCLAMGQGPEKVNLHFEQFYDGVDGNLRARFTSRPLIINVMEYSTAGAVEKMIRVGADLAELYTVADELPTPVAFWAFRASVSLQTTLVVSKLASTNLRDANGASMLHHAVNMLQHLRPEDHNGRSWISLIILTLLNRGIKLELRDCWGRTARDIATNTPLHLCAHMGEQPPQTIFRTLEENAPDPYELREITDPTTGIILSPEAIIDRRVAQLAFYGQVDAIEDLILHDYNYICEASMGFQKRRTALELAEAREHRSVLDLLKHMDVYRKQIWELRHSVIQGDADALSRMASEKKLLWSCDQRGRTLLHLAVIHHRQQVALLLADLCPELAQLRDCFGRTPMHYAACLNDDRFLFRKLSAQLGGVDKQMTDYRGISIASYAELFKKGVPYYTTLVQREFEACLSEKAQRASQIFTTDSEGTKSVDQEGMTP
ncbi:unnamed protein product [Dicrocoelium dendriticum]|nr:unnamed protein product [Dicrocoelium dendriticum]